jgi:hypothetical protein
METGNSPRSTRDALTLELLGDLGRVDDKITLLEQRIDALPEALAAKIVPSVGAVTRTMTEAKVAARQIQNDLADVARQLAQLRADAGKAESQERWQWLLAYMIGGILCGLVAFFGMHWFHTP